MRNDTGLAHSAVAVGTVIEVDGVGEDTVARLAQRDIHTLEQLLAEFQSASTPFAKDMFMTLESWKWLIAIGVSPTSATRMVQDLSRWCGCMY